MKVNWRRLKKLLITIFGQMLDEFVIIINFTLLESVFEVATYDHHGFLFFENAFL